MGADLQPVERQTFEATIAAMSPIELSPQALDQLWVHYRELARWNRRLSLIGPGTSDEAIERHYGESLAALSLLEPSDRVLVDVGTGAGFPGWVLAAARPDLQVTLVEARQKKWSFLSLVSEKAALPCRCLNARVGASLPRDFPQQMDVVASRAVKFSRDEITALGRRLRPRGRFLMWTGAEMPQAVETLRRGREIRLEGSVERRIQELFPSAESL